MTRKKAWSREGSPRGVRVHGNSVAQKEILVFSGLFQAFGCVKQVRGSGSCLMMTKSPSDLQCQGQISSISSVLESKGHIGSGWMASVSPSDGSMKVRLVSKHWDTKQGKDVTARVEAMDR